MKQLKFVSAFFITFALLFSLGCASTNTHESTGQFVDDSAITNKVRIALFDEPTLKSTEIRVETYKGIVQLSGFVRSQANIDKAVDLTSHVPGVQSVKNSMLIK
jgi:osmotically-inducible protein OsmY